MGLSDTEIPVFVNAHRGSVRVPAGVGKQEVLKAGQHLNGTTGKEKVVFNMADVTCKTDYLAQLTFTIYSKVLNIKLNSKAT